MLWILQSVYLIFIWMMDCVTKESNMSYLKSYFFLFITYIFYKFFSSLVIQDLPYRKYPRSVL